MALSLVKLTFLSTVVLSSCDDEYEDIPDGNNWPIIWWKAKSIASPSLMMVKPNVPASLIHQQFESQHNSPLTPPTTPGTFSGFVSSVDCNLPSPQADSLTPLSAPNGDPLMEGEITPNQVHQDEVSRGARRGSKRSTIEEEESDQSAIHQKYYEDSIRTTSEQSIGSDEDQCKTINELADGGKVERDIVERSAFEESADVICNPPPKNRKSKNKDIPPTVSDEQLLRDRMREAEAARMLLKQKESKDKVAIFDFFVSDSECLEVEDRLIYEFEEHLIRSQEYPLVLVWRRFSHSNSNDHTKVGYYGDPAGVLIVSIVTLSRCLMVPFHPDLEGQVREELASIIERIMSFDKVHEMEDLWQTLMTKLRKEMALLMKIPKSANAAKQFIRYITAATVAHHKGAVVEIMSSPIEDENMYHILRLFVLITWSNCEKQLLQRMERIITDSKLSHDGKVPRDIKRMIPPLLDEFRAIEETLNMLVPNVTISANDFSEFCMNKIHGFDQRVALLDSVLNIAQAIHYWRGLKNHGIIAVSIGPLVADSWEIGRLLLALGYDESLRQITRERVHYDSKKGYYYKPFVPDIGIAARVNDKKKHQKRKGKDIKTTILDTKTNDSDLL